jgi:hypothetical protein
LLSLDVTGSYTDLLSDANESQLMNSSTDDNGRVTLNGRTDVVVLPLSMLDVTLGSHFVVSMWLKHKEGSTISKVEQVLCLANDASSSFGCHLSISIQEKCHLIFSLHPESVIGETVIRHGKLGPTLWKWRLHQLCDSAWHHYVIQMQYPQVMFAVYIS